MPITPTAPGVYIEEIPSGVRTITGVATSIAAFVGYTARGLDHRPRHLFSFSDFEREFGGLASDSELSYAVQQFFQNGGGEAWVVRVPRSDGKASAITLENKAAGSGVKSVLSVTALSRGAWGNSVLLDVDYEGVADDKSFNLTIMDVATGNVETFDNVTMDATRSNYVAAVVNDEDNGSRMVAVEVVQNATDRPVPTGTVGEKLDLAKVSDNTKAYKIKVTSDVPPNAIKDLEVAIFEVGEEMPGSILGLCRLVERKLTAALGEKLDGAAARCSPVKTSTGDAIRVQADFSPEKLNGALDAQITFAAGATGNDADAALKLSSGTANVGHYRLGSGRTTAAQKGAVKGDDGKKLPMEGDLIGKASDFSGIYALNKVDLFNLLCIPDATRAKSSDPFSLDDDAGNALKPNAVFSEAMKLCKDRRAFLLIDPPPHVYDPERAVDWKTSGLTVRDTNGAAYFPRLRLPDPLNDFQLRTFAPCGVVAGLMSRIDSNRGVWKAPAGTEATLVGVQELVYKLNDGENGALNPLGLNCFRTFPIYGRIAWGARTLVGSDSEASEWKYVPVRRLALFIEESLYRGTKWVVFEPNDEPLWAQIRLNVGAFMNDLFRQGAFQGRSPREAYLVKCDKETTTQNDINKGIVNILVGFAPLKPAEFVIIKITQLAGQIQV